MQSGVWILVNIYAEPDSDFDLQENEICCVNIFGVGSEIKYYADEESFAKADTKFEPISMIPIGTFPLYEERDFKESPHTIFTGKIIDVDRNSVASPDEPNYCVTVETLVYH